MKVYIAFLMLLVTISVYAEERIPTRDLSPAPVVERSSSTPERTSQREPSAKQIPAQTSRREPSAEQPTNQTAPLHEAAQSAHQFRLITESCINETITLTSQPQLTSTADQWFLKTPTALIQLNRDLSNFQQLKLQLPPTFQPQPALNYPLYYKLSPTMQLAYTGLDMHFCNVTSAETFDAPHRQGELLVLLTIPDEPAVTEQLENYGFLISNRLLVFDNFILLTAQGNEQKLRSVIKQLRKAFPQISIDSNDYYFPATHPRVYLQHNLNWPTTTDCPHIDFSTIKIGIIDGLVNLSHPNLVDSHIRGKTFVDTPATDTTHATVIAALLTGNDPKNAITGLLPQAKLFTAHVVEPSAYGEAASVSAIVQAFNWLRQQSVRLINLSLAGNSPNRVLKMAIQTATQQGMLIFAAAGNNGNRDSPSYPAGFNKVFAITAVDAANAIYTNANQGGYIDFAAPGVDLWTIDNKTEGRYRSGTSFATPLALAVAASYLTFNSSLPEALLYESLRRNSKDLGKNGHDPVFGWGLVQPFKQQCL